MRKYQKSKFYSSYFGWCLRAISNSDIFEKQAELGVPHSKSKRSWPNQNFGP